MSILELKKEFISKYMSDETRKKEFISYLERKLEKIGKNKSLRDMSPRCYKQYMKYFSILDYLSIESMKKAKTFKICEIIG